MKYLLVVAAIATVSAFSTGCSSSARSVDIPLSEAVHDVARNEPGMHYVATTAKREIALFSVGYADAPPPCSVEVSPPWRSLSRRRSGLARTLPADRPDPFGVSSAGLPAGRASASAVHIASVSDFDNDYDQLLVFNQVENR